MKNLFEYMRRVALIWIGFCFLMLGLIGTIFPFLPGILFLLMGLVFVARGSDTFRRHHYIKRLFRYIRTKLKKQKGLVRRLASFF